MVGHPRRLRRATVHGGERIYVPGSVMPTMALGSRNGGGGGSGGGAAGALAATLGWMFGNHHASSLSTTLERRSSNASTCSTSSSLSNGGSFGAPDVWWDEKKEESLPPLPEWRGGHMKTGAGCHQRAVSSSSVLPGLGPHVGYHRGGGGSPYPQHGWGKSGEAVVVVGKGRDGKGAAFV
ncbi:hypothetical protein BC829DRAFT_384049, partial [Chytridium lagenaria]